MRVWVKKFIRIPLNTAAHTFNLIAAGDLPGMIQQSNWRTARRLEERESGNAIQGPDPAPPDRGLKYLPRGLSPLLRAIYHSRCR